MKTLLLLLFLTIQHAGYNVNLTVDNRKQCDYQVLLYEYNDKLYKKITVPANIRITIKGESSTPYFKAVFIRIGNADCGCLSKGKEDCPECESTLPRIWKNKSNFAVFVKVEDTFVLTREQCKIP